MRDDKEDSCPIAKKFVGDITMQPLFRALCGKRLGDGHSRAVYECELNPEYVVKFCIYEGGFQNVWEWETWLELRSSKWHSEWLAPCVSISPCGSILIQKRTKPLGKRRLPAKVPKFLSDVHRSNFGVYKGRIVAHDYAINHLMRHGRTKALKKTPKWDLRLTGETY